MRAPRLGHVCVDLATIRDTATVDADEPVDLRALPWPDADGLDRSGSRRASSSPSARTAPRPAARLVGTSLYLDRYWREERQVAADLLALPARRAVGVDARRARRRASPGSSRTRPPSAGSGAPPRRRVRQRFAVVAGGPGTGKTTTVARIVALLAEQARGRDRPPLVALAAPTGKAAARLEEAVHDEAAGLDVDATRSARSCSTLGASTLHRLLGWQPGSHSRFRHDRGNRLPHDVVIVDETSMVSLSLMARLVEAVRPRARLVLVGDPGQLTSVEAGAVLGDIVGAAAACRAARRARLAVVGLPDRVGDGVVLGVTASAAPSPRRRGDPPRRRRRGHRRARRRDDDVTWIAVDVATRRATRWRRSATARSPPAAPSSRPPRAGDARTALDGARRASGCCAPTAAARTAWRRWTAADRGLARRRGRRLRRRRPWYVGRPLLVTENDYGLRLYNGDTGVVVATGDGRVERGLRAPRRDRRRSARRGSRRSTPSTR